MRAWPPDIDVVIAPLLLLLLVLGQKENDPPSGRSSAHASGPGVRSGDYYGGEASGHAAQHTPPLHETDKQGTCRYLSLMTGGLVGLLMLGFWMYAIADAVMTPKSTTRLLPKWAWIAGIVIFWVIGAAAWMLLGRPAGAPLGFSGRGSTSDARDEVGSLSDRERVDLDRREYYRRMDEELDRRLERRRLEGETGSGAGPATGGPGPEPA